MSDDAGADIIDLPLWVTQRKRGPCTHPGAAVDMTAASLSCTECKAEIDPWWYLRRMAQEGDTARFAITSARRERERINLEIDKLKALRRTLRAQVARLQGKLALDPAPDDQPPS